MTIHTLKGEFLPSLAPEDFFVLLAHATGKSREFLLAHPEYALSKEGETRIREFFARRLKREPVAYITGEKEFYGRTYRVTRDTLIPRPETEMLVAQVIEDCGLKIAAWKSAGEKKILIADIGTGSGAIIIALASELRNDASEMIHRKSFVFHSTDISESALEIARENARRHDVDELISFHAGDTLEPVREYLDDADAIIITANLPYLSLAIYESADPDVRDYEPREALVSGEDGLDHYRRLFTSIADIRPGHSGDFTVFCEISPEQASEIASIAASIFPYARHLSVIPDLSGRSRVFCLSLGRR